MKKNYKRMKERKWKPRIPVPKVDRIIELDTVYNRHKQKEAWDRILRIWK